MQKIAAQLRHRELTQEIYNIGDEVAEYIEHIAEAIADCDDELVSECLAECKEIVEDARRDSRRIVGELVGLRQALTSGIRAGILSASAAPESRLPEPELLDTPGLSELFPTDGPASTGRIFAALDSRTELVGQHLAELVEYTLEQTDLVARDLNAVSLPHLYARVGTLVEVVTTGWLNTVAMDRGYIKARRGQNPPEFLVDRARIDAIVAKIAAKKAAANNRNFAS